MSFEKAKADLEEKGLGDHVIALNESSATVAEAAHALGVEPASIAKTLSVLQGEKPVLSFNSALILLGALGILPHATSAMLHNLSTLGISLRSGECIACEACVGTCPKQNIHRWDTTLCKRLWLPVLGKVLLFFLLGCWLGFCRFI